MSRSFYKSFWFGGLGWLVLNYMLSTWLVYLVLDQSWKIISCLMKCLNELIFNVLYLLSQQKLMLNIWLVYELLSCELISFFFWSNKALHYLRWVLLSKRGVSYRHSKHWFCHRISLRVEVSKNKIKGDNIKERHKVIDIKHDTEQFRLIPSLLQELDQG